MTRLYRPHVPLETRCQVAARQLGWNDPAMLLRLHRPDPRSPKGEAGHGRLLDRLLPELADKLGCEVSDLRLDHDPALGARPKRFSTVYGCDIYTPDANDPEHLVYREKHAHHIKTNVKGDGAQHPDRVLIKKARRIENPKPKKKHKWASRPFNREKK